MRVYMCPDARPATRPCTWSGIESSALEAKYSRHQGDGIGNNVTQSGRSHSERVRRYRRVRVAHAGVQAKPCRSQGVTCAYICTGPGLLAVARQAAVSTGRTEDIVVRRPRYSTVPCLKPLFLVEHGPMGGPPLPRHRFCVTNRGGKSPQWARLCLSGRSRHKRWLLLVPALGFGLARDRGGRNFGRAQTTAVGRLTGPWHVPRTRCQALA